MSDAGVGPALQWSFSLDSESAVRAEQGDTSVLLFKTRTTQNPSVILLIGPSEVPKVASTLEAAGVSLDHLAESLLPVLNLLVSPDSGSNCPVLWPEKVLCGAGA